MYRHGLPSGRLRGLAAAAPQATGRSRVISALEVALLAIGTLLIALFLGGRITGEMERRQAVADFSVARAATVSLGDILAGFGSDPRPADGIEPLPRTGTPDSTQPPHGPSSARGTGETSHPRHSTSLPIALLRIPRIGLEVPVFGDTSERNLNRGAGWVEGTAAPDDGGNFAAAAHRDAHFRPLKDVVVGDVLELESLESRRGYTVTEISIVDPDDVSVLHATSSAVVTLITCYPFYFIGNAPQRYIVRAIAVN